MSIETHDPHRLDKRRVRRSFERAAGSYDRVAILQREVADRMAERLDIIKAAPKSVLDVGSGTGYGSRMLLNRYPQAQVYALDLALTMLQAARAAHPWWKRSLPFAQRTETLLCGDLESLPLGAEAVDMIWSNLAVQWSNDLPHALTEMQRVLAPGGLLMFSTFGPDTLKELRQAFGDVDGRTHVSRFIDMHDIGDMLTAAGFAHPVMDMECITLTYDTLPALMRDLKALGAHNATAGRATGLTGKRAWQRLEAAYEPLRRDGRLPATFEVVYGHAWKADALRAPDGRRAIPVKPIRQ